jgi:hypothetical protein
MQNHANEVDLHMVEEELRSADVAAGSWALNELVDGRHCLVWREGHWAAGFFERGRFDIRFEDGDARLAVSKFIEWVAASEESTRLSAEATRRWLEREGKSRP